MMRFVKYHGTGNDFILLDHEPVNPSELAKRLCDRHMGIGADGLIFPSTSKRYDIGFQYYNADGSIAPMCGNGMRTFVKFLCDQKIMLKPSFVADTLAGPIPVKLNQTSGLISVNLGPMKTELGEKDVAIIQKDLKKIILDVEGIKIETYTVMLGTLHTIVYIEPSLDIEWLGPKISVHPYFPQGTNVNFVSIHSRKSIEVKTHERGVGWTLSCGTGSAASASVSHVLGKIENHVSVKVPGGMLQIEVGPHVLLTGPAVRIAEGVFYE